jgi:hypothetical protein
VLRVLAGVTVAERSSASLRLDWFTAPYVHNAPRGPAVLPTSGGDSVSIIEPNMTSLGWCGRNGGGPGRVISLERLPWATLFCPIALEAVPCASFGCALCPVKPGQRWGEGQHRSSAWAALLAEKSWQMFEDWEKSVSSRGPKIRIYLTTGPQV